MKTLTLTQPWATLVAVGAKHIETRSWATKYRGPLAIHAAKGFPKAVQDSVRYDMRFFAELNPSYAAHMARTGLKLPPTSVCFETLGKLPRGAVIATCMLVNCREIIGSVYPKMPDGEYVVLGNRIIPPPPPELYFGDYSPGALRLDASGYSDATRADSGQGRSLTVGMEHVRALKKSQLDAA